MERCAESQRRQPFVSALYRRPETELGMGGQNCAQECTSWPRQIESTCTRYRERVVAEFHYNLDGIGDIPFQAFRVGADRAIPGAEVHWYKLTERILGDASGSYIGQARRSNARRFPLCG
jgi:hypothetical protein